MPFHEMDDDLQYERFVSINCQQVSVFSPVPLFRRNQITYTRLRVIFVRVFEPDAEQGIRKPNFQFEMKSTFRFSDPTSQDDDMGQTKHAARHETLEPAAYETSCEKSPQNHLTFGVDVLCSI
jgi:hypothetical protein